MCMFCFVFNCFIYLFIFFFSRESTRVIYNIRSLWAPCNIKEVCFDLSENLKRIVYYGDNGLRNNKLIILITAK